MAAASNSVHETFLTGRCVGGIEEVLSQGQQDTITTIHSVDSALLSPPQTSDDGPEPFQSHVEDIVHGLTKLFPYPFLCLGDRHSNSPLRLPVPICGSQDSHRLKRPDTTPSSVLQHLSPPLSKYCHPCPSPLAIDSFRVEESPNPLKKVVSGPFAIKWSEADYIELLNLSHQLRLLSQQWGEITRP